jgi:chemotaxis protein histidine kinase CheA
MTSEVKVTMEESMWEGMRRLMEEELVSVCVEKLSKEYSFDKEEALGLLGVKFEVGEKKKKEKKSKKAKFTKPSVQLPFCNALLEGRCNGVCLSSRLYTQCLKPAGESGLCGACVKQCEKNDHGKPNYGLITDRVDNPEWCDPKGKRPIRYASYMLKNSISKDDAVAEATKLGWVIADEQFEVEAKKEKKSKAADKKRGRPAKNKGVETGGTGDDLIAQLVAQAKAEETGDEESVAESVEESVAESVEESDAESVVEQVKPTKKVTVSKEEKEAAKLKAKEEKEAAKLKAKEEKEAAKLKAKEEKEAAKLKAKEEKEAAKKATQKTKKAVEAPKIEVTDDVVAELQAKVEELELEEEEVDEEATPVVKFEHNGVTYLKDEDGVMYDMESQEPVGRWDGSNMVELDEDSDEEEEA